MLSTLPSEALPDIETVTEREHELIRETGRTVRAGVWATFLQSIGVSVGGDHDRRHIQTYTVDELETRYLRAEPSAAEVARRMAEPAVQAAVHSGLFGRSPVYMVTGCKIARGFSVRSEASLKRGVEVKTTVPVVESVSVGAELRGEKRNTVGSSFRGAEEDIVFAYQLHIIKEKGRKDERTVEVDTFLYKEALLHEGDGAADISDISFCPAIQEDLQDAVEQGATEDLLLTTEGAEDRGELIRIVFRKDQTN